MNTPKIIQETFTGSWIQTHEFLMFMVSVNGENLQWIFQLGQM